MVRKSLKTGKKRQVGGRPGATLSTGCPGRRLLLEPLEHRQLLTSGLPFLQQTTLAPSDGAAQDRFGNSVAISGNTLVVGAPDANGGKGAAYVFSEPTSGWSSSSTTYETAELTASDGASGDWFGWSVAISGNTIVVGAPSATVNGNSDQGAAYVFTEGTSGWTSTAQTAKLTEANGQAGDWFGWSVSISGNTLLVGAPGNTSVIYSVVSAAYVFTEPGSAWVDMHQTAKLTDNVLGDLFGCAVAISGNMAAVGAENAKSGQGAAYLFSGSGSSWTSGGSLVEADAAEFGCALAISGNSLVVGASLTTVGTVEAGAAYVFTGPGPAWTGLERAAKLTASDYAANAEFGSSVTISGNAVVVGAPNATIGSNLSEGAAYVYTEPASGWTNMNEAAKLTDPYGSSDETYGRSVAITGNTLVIGADAFNNIYGGGDAYVFTAAPPGNLGVFNAGYWYLDINGDSTWTSADGARRPSGRPAPRPWWAIGTAAATPSWATTSTATGISTPPAAFRCSPSALPAATSFPSWAIGTARARPRWACIATGPGSATWTTAIPGTPRTRRRWPTWAGTTAARTP